MALSPLQVCKVKSRAVCNVRNVYNVNIKNDEDGGPRAEDGRRKTEDRGQKTEDRRRWTDRTEKDK